jgi:hypothetical protein
VHRVTAWLGIWGQILILAGMQESRSDPDPAAQPPGRSAQSSSLRDEREFAADVQRAMRTNDRDVVADLIRYPARVSVRLRPYPIYVKDRAALMEMYDMVFTPHLRCAIVESREPANGTPQPVYPLLVARSVVSLAGGRVIAERAQGKYRITRITSFGDTSTRLGRPRPVTFSAGRREVELGGRVAEAGADAYLVTAGAGARLQASIKGFPAGSLSLRVSRRGSATFLDGADQSGQVWTGRLTEGGEYLVEVVRRAPYCKPPVISHLVTLSLTDR